MLYQIICLMDTPPVTKDEQHLCMHSPDECWRLKYAADRGNGRNGRNGHVKDEQEPVEARRSSRKR